VATITTGGKCSCVTARRVAVIEAGHCRSALRQQERRTRPAYFSDGVTEDIITELSRFHLLTVIASHSSFAFRDQSLGIPEIGRRLGAAYILDGSLWKAGDRLRIAARLLDADSGRQLWAERYDRELRDIFAIRDEVVQSIVATLPDRIVEAGAQSARRKRSENLEAYDHLLRGIAHLLTLDRAEEPQARFDRAVIALDPDCATAYALLAFSHLRTVPRDRTRGALTKP
jgi:adenylate cyclase